MLTRLVLSAALVFGTCSSALAVPAKIIILRHGEKQDGFALCTVGVQRSLALSVQFIGKGGADSLFAVGETPAAFFAITLHTIELASPAARTWSAPLIAYSAVPISGSPLGDSDVVLNARTQQAAADVLNNPAWNGKTVVMVWEHKHIANKKLEKAYPGQKVTLRQLLGLDTLGSQVPDKWEGDNYDYFWVVTYGNPNSPVPTGFQTIKQHFAKPYDGVPHNDWGKPEGLPKNAGCKS
ncbi:MAG TPA: hypothetical protein VNU97_01735 [Rhizomicrobium sp.]|jgi:hypothetical protein|nr:hypothetical protein [Rhizomicrobium sp.]